MEWIAFSDEFANGVEVGDVDGDALSRQADIGHGIDHALDIGSGARRHRHMGARLGEGNRRAQPDPAGAAGNQGTLAIETETGRAGKHHYLAASAVGAAAVP